MDVLALEPRVAVVAVWKARALGGVPTHLCSLTTLCMSPPPAFRLDLRGGVPYLG